MWKWLFAVVVLTFLAMASEGRADEGVAEEPVAPQTGVVWKAARAIHSRLVGLVLVSQLRPGMTEDEMDRVIGHIEVDEGQFGPFDGYWFGSRRYAFRVSVYRDQSGQRRITSVTLRPLFGN